jgi:hypothetical protein
MGMVPPELDDEEGPSGATPSQPADPPRYGRYVALLAILILIFITLNTVLTKPNGAGGVGPGEAMPPFAVPLATGGLPGDANVATTGPHTACTVRKPGVLNICELYEQGPVVLALFVDGGSCTRVLSEMQTLAPEYPKLRFAAVSIMGDRRSLRRLVAQRHLSFPVGLDDKGDLAALYRLATCPQVTFALRGGTVESKALLNPQSLATMRARVAELAAAGPAGGASG